MTSKVGRFYLLDCSVVLLFYSGALQNRVSCFCSCCAVIIIPCLVDSNWNEVPGNWNEVPGRLERICGFLLLVMISVGLW